MQRTYGVEIGCTACHYTADVRTWAREYGHCVAENPYFHQTSHSSCFPYLVVVLVELRLIEGFSQIWRTQIFQSFRRHISIQVSFNSHNAHCYFLCTARLFCVPNKHAYFTTLTVYTIYTWTLSFWEKICAEHVNQVRLVKWPACRIQIR
jgi:hypothetical protein